MDLNRDELRRRIRQTDAANQAAMPRWRSALQQLLQPDSTLTVDEKAALLGVPSPGRRQLFRVGGATILGAAVLAACGDDDDAGTAETGSAPTTTAGGGTEPNLDLTLAKTAVSIEQLAVAAYTTALDAGVLTDRAVADAAATFRDHHVAHADALNGVVTGAGQSAVTEPNAVLFDALVRPVLDAGPTQQSIVMLAYDLETAAVQAYAFAGVNLSTPELRSTIMTIGGVEARHAAILKVVAQGAAAPDVFEDGAFISAPDAGIPEEAFVS